MKEGKGEGERGRGREGGKEEREIKTRIREQDPH